MESVVFDDVEAIKETDLALLCVVDGNDVWIPKSQITDDSEVWQEGDTGKLEITEWFAEKEGLI